MPGENSAAAATIQRVFRRKQQKRLPWPKLSELKRLYMDEFALAAGAENGEMYTDEMILKRERLRSDARVVEALDGAWERMVAARGGTDGTSIAREPYMAMSRKLYLFFKCQQMEAYLDPDDCFSGMPVLHLSPLTSHLSQTSHTTQPSQPSQSSQSSQPSHLTQSASATGPATPRAKTL